MMAIQSSHSSINSNLFHTPARLNLTDVKPSILGQRRANLSAGPNAAATKARRTKATKTNKSSYNARDDKENIPPAVLAVVQPSSRRGFYYA